MQNLKPSSQDWSRSPFKIRRLPTQGEQFELEKQDEEKSKKEIGKEEKPLAKRNVEEEIEEVRKKKEEEERQIFLEEMRRRREEETVAAKKDAEEWKEIKGKRPRGLAPWIKQAKGSGEHIKIMGD